MDLRVAGFSTLEIAIAGGWKSERMVNRYTSRYVDKENAVMRRMKHNPWEKPES